MLHGYFSRMKTARTPCGPRAWVAVVTTWCADRFPALHAGEVDEAAFRLGRDESDSRGVSDVEALLAAHDPALRGWPDQPRKHALVRGAGDDRVERLADV